MVDEPGERTSRGQQRLDVGCRRDGLPTGEGGVDAGDPRTQSLECRGELDAVRTAARCWERELGLVRPILRKAPRR